MFKFLFKLLKENAFLISLFSMVLCCFTYLYQVFELRKWEIPLGMVDGVKVQYLFVIVLGLLYFFSAAYLQEYIRIKFCYYVPIRLANKALEKIMKKIKKMFHESIDGGLKERIEGIETKCKRIGHGIMGTIVFVILIGISCFLPFFALFFILVLDSSWTMVSILFCLAMITTIFTGYLTVSKSTRREIRLIEKKCVKPDSGFDDYLFACKKIADYEEIKLDKSKSKKRSSNSNTDYLVVFVTAIIMFIFGMSVKLNSAPPKEYWIYTFESGDSYASVLEMNDTFVLKKAIIDGDSIKLLLNEQVITNASDKVFRHYVFKNASIEK